MSKDILDEFHRLVAAEQYRDARGILESEPDVDPDVADKWLNWLDELHTAERIQVGIDADAKKRDPTRAKHLLAQHIGGTVAAVLGSVILWFVVVVVLTHDTSSIAGGGIFLLVGLTGGFVGWQYGARFISPRHHLVIGGVISFGLLLYLLSSGIPMWYFYDPPLHYLIAGFLLLAPATAYLAYRLGSGVGSFVWNRLNRIESI